jgi:hypothetical protein
MATAQMVATTNVFNLEFMSVLLVRVFHSSPPLDIRFLGIALTPSTLRQSPCASKSTIEKLQC